MKPLRVLAIYRHYWPDATPYALILRSILERLAARGANVTVYTAQPSYGEPAAPRQPWVEQVGGVQVRRVAMPRERRRWAPLRVVNACYFLFRAIAHTVGRRRYDLVIANAHPPIAIGVALRVIQWLTGARYLLHLQDLHPEAYAAIHSGKQGLLYRAALAIETANCRDAAHLVTLSTDMRDTLAARGLPVERVALINNCPLDAPTCCESALPDCLTDDSPTRFLFAGNLGRFQGLDALIAAAHRIAQRSDWRMIFMGSGVMREQLCRAAGPLLGERIFFLDRQPVAVARAAMRVCDYGIVSLSAGVCRYAYPSKSMTYLAEGCPLLAVVEPDTELARTLRDQRLGLTSDGFTEGDIAITLRTAIERRNEWTPAERRRIARQAEQLFGAPRMHAQWDAVFDRLAPGRLIDVDCQTAKAA